MADYFDNKVKKIIDDLKLVQSESAITDDIRDVQPLTTFQPASAEESSCHPQ